MRSNVSSWPLSKTARAILRLPTGFGFHAGLGALWTNRFEDALERFLANDRDTPCYRAWYALWTRTAQAYHMLGRYQEELDVVRQGLERFPSHRPLIYFEAIALAGLGRLDALDSLVDVIVGLPPQSGYSPGSQMAVIALELKALGRRDAYETLMGRALAWFAEQPASELRYVRGRTFYWAERWSDADTLLAALIAEEPDNIGYRGVRGVSLAHLGRRDEALEFGAWLAQLDGLFLDGTHTRWRAAIAAALGSREDAVRLLQQAYDEGMELGYYHHRDPEWESLRDYRPYQEFVRAR